MRLIKNNDNPINEGKIINQIRALGLDMIEQAKSGHPGIVLGAAPIIYTLYARHLRICPEKPDFFNRDRFIMSAGHGSALLYATLFMAGYDLDLDDLKKFRQIGSKTPGHPEYGVTPGVDMTTGPLGQGIATAVGFALAEARLRDRFNKYEKDLIDFNTYVLCGDGDLEEGISYEAMSLAGTLKLNKLIVLYDSNNVSLDGETTLTFNENIEMRMNSMGWNYIKVIETDEVSISKAIEDAKKSNDKPTLIEIKTTIGKYSILEGTNKVHGGALTKEDVSQIKEKLKLRDIEFSVSSDTVEDFQQLIFDRGERALDKFNKKYEALSDELKEELAFFMGDSKEIDLKNLTYEAPEDNKEALRDTSSKVLNSIVQESQFMVGGSADLFGAVKTYVNDGGDLSSKNYSGKNIYFGVREHAMGAILNGLALCGYRVYGSTFLSFSNYMIPAIRMSAMLNLPITYIFTHDSISLGEDGKTHQPVEHLALFRAMPNVTVYRPCDANEVIGVYKTIMKESSGVSIISLSKTVLPILETTKATDVSKGAYIVRKEKRKLDGILISTGEELHSAIEVAKRLEIKGIDIRVVSMPCIERFLKNDAEYIDEILPVGKKKIVIEAASSISWNRIVFNPKYLITLDQYGASGKRLDVLEKFGFDIDSLEKKIEELLK